MIPIAYLDTSVVLRQVLDEPGAFVGLRTIEVAYANELVRVEALRSIDRLRILNAWPNAEVVARIRALIAILAPVREIPIQPPILRRAADPFPTIVGTLDAIHIATALLTQEEVGKPLLFLTHDRTQGIAAEAAGMTAEGFPRQQK
ncbi:MAG: PIN domain-containing protein [Deltaproteobacteria bacterium]|nr:PIN domain-containing protein [Deltaproteobacteria bacterium]